MSRPSAAQAWAQGLAEAMLAHSFPCHITVQAVQDMCMHKMADKLYLKLQAVLDEHISAQITVLQGQLSLDPVLFLEKVRKCAVGKVTS